ncbi:hypothetical protein [Zhihengliuella sp.]|uniref:hypothetical protein n=1 Tax=Zhihengliuella sp. TaxID=1954483 RepID=UPI0028110513|nr:hypothetical protein [Zhihengliuella sp.]
MLTSILRTVVPSLWGGIVGWLLGLIPALEPLRADLLAYGDLMVPFLGALLVGLWYAFWRWLEPRLPAWLVRLVLGSVKTPTYEPSVRVGIDLQNRVYDTRERSEPDDDGYDPKHLAS